MFNRFFKVVCLVFFFPLGLWAQADSLAGAPNKPVLKAETNVSSLGLSVDSNPDSLKKLADSLSFLWIKNPDSNRPNRFRDSLIKADQVYNLDFRAWAAKFVKNHNREGQGKLRKQGEQWIILTVLFLFFGFGLLRNIFRKEIGIILNAFFSQTQAPAGGLFFGTWSFLFLNLFFGLTIGMYLFLAGKYFQLGYILNDFSWYLFLSFILILLFTLKIYVLRFLGLLFQIPKAVKTYISILYLTYFQAAILFLPLLLAFSLSSAAYAVIFLYAGIAFTALIIAYQLVRVVIHILSHYQFPKFYLFIYFCALEICPILILIKALRF